MNEFNLLGNWSEAVTIDAPATSTSTPNTNVTSNPAPSSSEIPSWVYIVIALVVVAVLILVLVVVGVFVVRRYCFHRYSIKTVSHLSALLNIYFEVENRTLSKIIHINHLSRLIIGLR